jgi:hypothetical protein
MEDLGVLACDWRLVALVLVIGLIGEPKRGNAELARRMSLTIDWPRWPPALRPAGRAPVCLIGVAICFQAFLGFRFLVLGSWFLVLVFVFFGFWFEVSVGLLLKCSIKHPKQVSVWLGLEPACQ